jgi:hypothetical protein
MKTKDEPDGENWVVNVKQVSSCNNRNLKNVVDFLGALATFLLSKDMARAARLELGKGSIHRDLL